jgi:hypothetical protein
MIQVAHRFTVLTLALLSISGLASCETVEPDAGVLVNVLLPSGDLQVDEIEIQGYPDGQLFNLHTEHLLSADGEPLDQSFNLLLWIPPDWIDHTIWLNVQGFNEGVATSHGQTSVVPVGGRIVESTIVLVLGDPPCGNSIVDAGEQCDATELAGQTCGNVTGLPHGLVVCDQCTLDTSGCHHCGDGTVEPEGGEACDSAELDGQTCQSLGFVTGTLECLDTCELDLSHCEQGCGNGIIEDVEVCDGTNLAGLGCPDFGFGRGYLSCDGACQFDLTNCAGTCDDGVLDPGESCDGSDFGEQTCFTAAGLESGDLGCTAACHLNVSGCYTCQDGAIEGPEQCDGSNLSGQDCLSQTGLPSGILVCDPVTCLFDTSDCN